MAYSFSWSRDDIAFELVDDLTAETIATIEVRTPAGTIQIMGEPRRFGRSLIVEGVHVSSEGLSRNAAGIANE